MIVLHHSGGASDFNVVAPGMPAADFERLKHNVLRLLRSRGPQAAAAMLEAIPFEPLEASNHFGDEFSILHASLPLGEYEKLRVRQDEPGCRAAFNQVASAFGELGFYVRFIAVDLQLEGEPPSSAAGASDNPATQNGTPPDVLPQIEKAQETQLEAWPVVLGLLFDVADSDTVCSIVGSSGLHVDWTLSKVEAFSHRTRNRAYRPRIESAYRALGAADRALVVSVMAAELARRYPQRAETIRKALVRIGWTLKMTCADPARTNQDATTMERNSELQKLLLIQVRDGREPPGLSEYPEAQQVYNSALLIHDGLVKGQAIEDRRGQYVSTVMTQLTSAGHDFLEHGARAGKPATESAFPPELTESLERFRMDHPNPASCGFVMMRFGTTKAHAQIIESIRRALAAHGFKALRADDKGYHDDLFWNILTYIHGCGFGVAVFERIEQEEFNPNISLEIGYTLALRKPVLLLKDKTLKNLNTDLVGRLYKTFDPQNISSSIGPEVERWLRDKNLIS